MSAIDAPEGVDGEALAAHLTERLGPAETLRARPLEGGSSNDTLLVSWGDRELVLRRPPPREPVPDLLHDVTREHDVLAAVEETSVPAPTPVSCCRDASILGAPFYLMERVEGEVLGGTEPERFGTPDRRRRVGEAMVEALADLHALDRDALEPSVAAGTADLEAAVAAHTDRLERALERTAERRELRRARAVGDWLADNVPAAAETVLVHGDYKPDNTMFAPGTPPRIAAVLDWEMAGAGDPLADLGWLLAYWAESRDPDPVDDRFESRFGDHEMYAAVEEYVSEHSGFMTREGYPSRRELVDHYEALTGRTYAHDRFYRALALYKLVAICEAFFALYLREPERAKPTYPLMAVMVPAIAARAALIVEGDSPL